MTPALPAGQPKVKSDEIAAELSQKWRAMDNDTKTKLTDPLLEEFAVLREVTDTKPKIIPVHVLNDVSSTMAKIICEVCL